MFGFQEILIISLIVLGAIFLPRMAAKKPAPRLIKPKNQFSGMLRTAIAVSIVYPMIVSAIMQPWRNAPETFFYIGFGPVLLGWLMFWVFIGFKNR